MSGKFSLTLIVLICCFDIGLTVNGQDDQPAKQPKVGESSPKQKSEDDMDRERVIALLHKQAFSKDPLIQQQAFRMLASNPDIHKALGDGVQLELVKAGLASNSGVTSQAMTILAESSIPGPERQDILINAFDSDDSNLRDSAFRLLSQDRNKVLSRIVEAIDRDPAGDHRVAIRLIERWGASASDATPVLVKRYEVLKAKAAKNKNASVDYLDIVYALAEIGPAAKAGLFIALDAAEESGKGDRKVYPMVGLACVERLLGGNFLKTSVLSDAEQKYKKYAESLMEAYDKDKDSRLSKPEVKAMRRPPVGADFDSDGFLTVAELIKNLAGSQTVNSKSRTKKGSLRNEIERLDYGRN